MSAPLAASPRRSGSRPLTEDDLPHLTALHRKAFGPPPGPAAGRLEGLFREIFFHHPRRDDHGGFRSLAHEDPDGRIVGCLGAMPRSMELDGRRLTAAVSHHFMVDPDHRAAPIALGLLRELFQGPQDLTLADGNESSRRLWTALGGVAPLAFAFHWFHPLRPAAHAVERARRHGLPRPLAGLARAPAALADLAVRRAPGSPLRERSSGRLAVAELDAPTLAGSIGRAAAPRSLRPCYDEGSLAWVLRTLTRWRGADALHTAALSDGGRTVGWWIYHVRPDHVAQVVQLGAEQPATREVLDQLLLDARRHGATAVTGRLDPQMLPALSERHGLFHRGPGSTWLLVHSRHPDVLDACHRGDAFLTHLEGEWWS